METKDYYIKQISVFSENKPGRLAAIAKVLQDENINIYAFSIAESKGFGVVRILVNKPAEALKKLTDLGHMVSYTDVIGVRMDDNPGGLYKTAEILGQNDINIEYAYAYSGKNGAIMVVRVDNIDEAVAKISASGLVLLKAKACGRIEE